MINPGTVGSSPAGRAEISSQLLYIDRAWENEQEKTGLGRTLAFAAKTERLSRYEDGTIVPIGWA